MMEGDHAAKAPAHNGAYGRVPASAMAAGATRVVRCARNLWQRHQFSYLPNDISTVPEWVCGAPVMNWAMSPRTELTVSDAALNALSLA